MPHRVERKGDPVGRDREPEPAGEQHGNLTGRHPGGLEKSARLGENQTNRPTQWGPRGPWCVAGGVSHAATVLGKHYGDLFLPERERLGFEAQWAANQAGQPTLGYENITLSYSYKVKEALENGDHVYVEWSSDGNLWITMEDLTNLPASEDWVTSSHLIGSPDQVEFRFRANLNAGEDRLFLDDVLLTGEVLEGRISGYKFYDADGSGGARDIFNDPGIAGWRIVLLDENGDEQDSTITAGVNGNDGDYIYIFNELADGVYTICESAYDNWTQTYPTGEVAGATACAEGEGYAPWGWEATIENGEIASGPESFDFSNAPELGVISVLKFNDRNGNGVRDEGEEGIGGIEFRLNTHGDSLALADDFLAQLFSFLIPEDLIAMYERLKKRTPAASPDDKYYEHYRIRRPDGEIRYIRDISFPLFDNKNTLIGFAGIARDMTRDKKHELELMGHNAEFVWQKLFDKWPEYVLDYLRK